MTGSIHDRDDLSQEAKDDLVARAVDEAIAGLRALADLTDVSLRSAADTAVWASEEGTHMTARAAGDEALLVVGQCAEYVGKADAELLSMYVNHCLEVELEDGLPVSTYPEYVEAMIRQYEQIWRESARDRDRDSCEAMLQALRPEGRKFPCPIEEVCVHGRAVNEHGWADCVECEAGDPDGTLPAEPGTEFCNACGQTHVPGDCDLAFEVVDLTVDLTVTIRSAEDPVQYVRNAMSFRDERGNNVTVTDVFRNDE